jgi:hypothetical protein
MRHLVIAALILVAVAGCTQKPAPVASDTTPVEPSERLAIAVEYVAVPKAIVYARPAIDAQEVGSYGLTEAVSILEKKGEWCYVRTFSGAGWIRQADLVAGDVAEKMDTTTPRFYVPPRTIPFNADGELWLQAKVNTEGDVVEVKTVKNTTGSRVLEDANATALKEARFYPMIEKGTRKTFLYEHRVYY